MIFASVIASTKILRWDLYFFAAYAACRRFRPCLDTDWVNFHNTSRENKPVRIHGTTTMPEITTNVGSNEIAEHKRMFHPSTCEILSNLVNTQRRLGTYWNAKPDFLVLTKRWLNASRAKEWEIVHKIVVMHQVHNISVQAAGSEPNSRRGPTSIYPRVRIIQNNPIITRSRYLECLDTFRE
jgi:hypothetical protein